MLCTEADIFMRALSGQLSRKEASFEHGLIPSTPLPFPHITEHTGYFCKGEFRGKAGAACDSPRAAATLSFESV